MDWWRGVSAAKQPARALFRGMNNGRQGSRGGEWWLVLYEEEVVEEEGEGPH